MAKWRVPLQGDQFDLAGLVMYLTSPELRVTREGDEYFLSGTDLDALPSERTVYDRVWELLPIIGGATHIREGNAQPITANAVEWEDQAGKNHRAVWATTETARARTSVLVARADGTMDPPSITSGMSRWIAIAKQDQNVANAPKIFGGVRTWRDLSNALESVKSALGNGRMKDGSDQIVNAGWATDAQLVRFCDTVNDPRVLGVDARHMHVQKPGKPAIVNPMSYQEAETLIRSIAQQWLETK